MAERAFLALATLIWLPYGIFCFFQPGFLADAAGVELGEVLSITELSGFLPIKVRAEFDAEVTSVPVQSGELSVTAQVQVVFKIR